MPATAAPTPKKIKLHQPAQREYPEDEVTVVGHTEDLFARVQAEPRHVPITAELGRVTPWPEARQP